MTGPAGLPLGYDHTETGAVEAATNYLTWMTLDSGSKTRPPPTPWPKPPPPTRRPATR